MLCVFGAGVPKILPGFPVAEGHWQCWACAVLVLVEMFKAHLVMIQRRSANPYARKTASEKGPRPGGAVKAPAYT